MSDNDNAHDAAVIAAVWSDWKTVKSRKSLVLMFEIPIEQQDYVLRILGPPLPDKTVWVAIAPLQISPETGKRAGAGKEPRIMEAVMACKDPRFQKWITWKVIGRGVAFSEETSLNALYVRCGITSRRELGLEGAVYDEARLKFDLLIGEFKDYYGLSTERR